MFKLTIIVIIIIIKGNNLNINFEGFVVFMICLKIYRFSFLIKLKKSEHLHPNKVHL